MPPCEHCIAEWISDRNGAAYRGTVTTEGKGDVTMCTICGHFARDGKIKSNDIYDMLKKMEHRGPDTHGIYMDGNIAQTDDIDKLQDALFGESHSSEPRKRLRWPAPGAC